MSEAQNRAGALGAGLGTWLRRGLFGVLGVLGLAVFLTLLLLASLQVDAVSTVVARRLAALASGDSLQIRVGRVTGSWVRGLRVTDLRLVAASGGDTAWSASVDSASASYRVLPLLRHTVDLGAVRVHGLAVRVAARSGEAAPAQAMTAPEAGGGARWRIEARRVDADVREVLLEGTQGDTATGTWALTAGRVALGDLVLDTTRTAVLDTVFASFRPPGRPAGWGRLAGRGVLEGGRLHLDALVLRSPESDVRVQGTLPLSLAGTAPEGLELAVRLAPLHLADVGPLLPGSLADSLHLRGRADVRTVSDTLRIEVEAASEVPGRLRVQGRVWGPRARPSVVGTVRVDSLDLGAWGLTPRSVVLDGTAGADVSGPWPGGLAGTVSARLRVDDPTGALDLRAELDAGADSTGGPWRADWSMSAPGVEGKGRARLEPGGPRPSWELDAALAYARGPASDTAAPAGMPAAASGRLTARGRGFAPDSMDADVDVRVDSARTVGGAKLGPGRMTGTLREGGVTAELWLDAAGGRLEMEGGVDLRAGTARIRRGVISGMDLAGLAGDTVPSRLDGGFEGAVSDFSPLRASGSVWVTAAEYGTLALDSARAVLEARAQEVGVRVSVALSDSGEVELSGRLTTGAGPLGAVVDSVAWRHLDLRALTASADSSPLPPTDLSGWGRGRATREDAGWMGSATLELDSSRVGEATVRSGSLAAERDRAGARATLALESSAGGVEGRASLSGTGPRSTVELTRLVLRALDLGALSGGALPSTSLSGSASGTLSGRDLATGVGSLRADLGPSRVAATALDTLHLQASVDSGTVRGDGWARGLGGRVDLNGRGEFAERPGWSVEGRVVRPPGDGDRALFARFGVEAVGSRAASAEAEAWVEVDSARWAGRPLDRGVARVSLADGLLSVDTLEMELPGARITGSGTLAVEGDGRPSDTLRFASTLTRADLLAGLMGSGVLALGEARLDLDATGSLDRLGVGGRATVSALLVNDIRIQGMELRGQGRRSASEGWTAAEAHLTVDRMRLPTAPVQRVVVDAGLDSDDQMVITASAIVDGRRDAEMSARIEDLRIPSTVLLERFSFRADQDRWELERPTRVSFQDGLRVDSLRLASGTQEIVLQGNAGRTGPLDLHAALEAFDIATVADLLGFPTLSGRVTGSLDLTGTGEDPIVDARLESRFEPVGAPPGNLSLTLGYEGRTAVLEGSVGLDEGGSLRLQGSVPLRLSFDSLAPTLVGDAPIRATAGVDAFPLAWFEPFVPASVAGDLEGTLDGSVEVGGRAHAASFDGAMRLRGAAVRLPALGMRYREARMDLRFQGNRILVDSARVRSDEGALTATGTVTVARVDRPTYDLTVRADGFEVMRTSAIRASVSGSVEIDGQGLAPRVTGRVDVERADLYLGDLLSSSNVADVTLSEEQWEELARVFGYERSSRRTRRAPFMETATLDLDVRLGRASWVRQRANPQLALQFSGEMSVQKEPGDSLQLLGSVEAVPDRSWVEQFGRRFSIQEGRLTFRGPPSATQVEVQARYEVPSRDNPGEPEVVMALAVSGTPGSLSLELSSTPTLEASDMVSYLVTGRPASQSLAGGGNGSLTSAGGALALGRLSGAVEAYAREQVGLDVVEITTDGLDGVTLVAGRYVSPDLYLGIRQPVSMERSSADPSQRAPATELEVELQAMRWLLLNLRAGGRGGVEFYVRSRLAYD